MKRITFTFALMLMLFGGAYAQRVQTTPYAQSDDLSAAPSFTQRLDGQEISPGVGDVVDDVVWGNTISLRGETADFTASINRGGFKPDVENGNKIVGGSWTLSVYKGGEFNGMLFGEFTGGDVQWYTDKSGTIMYGSNIGAELVIKGGTGSFAGIGGPRTYGKFSSTSMTDANGTLIYSGSITLIY